MNRLSPETATRVFGETLPMGQKPMQLLTTGDSLRSIHGVSYTRLWNLDLVNVLREFATDFMPPQEATGGGTGLYGGEQDMFAFLIDPTGWLCERTSLPEHGPCHRRFRRVGENEERSSDVRILAATNRDLLSAISDGEFREDLFYRLAVVTIKLPPLRDRKTDIGKIAEHLLKQINSQFRAEEHGYRDKLLSDSAMTFVKRHRWPGNVRQLQNALVQAAVLADGEVIDRQDLADAVADVAPRESGIDVILNQPIGDGFSLTTFLEDVQRKYLRRAMAESHGVKTKAARMLGYSNYQTLAAQLERLGVAESAVE